MCCLPVAAVWGSYHAPRLRCHAQFYMFYDILWIFSLFNLYETAYIWQELLDLSVIIYFIVYRRRDILFGKCSPHPLPKSSDPVSSFPVRGLSLIDFRGHGVFFVLFSAF